MVEIFKSEPSGKLSAILPEVYEQEGFSVKDCWINLVNPSDKEVAFVSALTGLEDDILKAPLDDEERSRIEQEDDYLMVLVDMPVIDEEDDYYSYYTIPMGTFIKQNVIVTVSLRESTALRDFVRVTTITALYLVFLIVQPLFTAPAPTRTQAPSAASEQKPLKRMTTPSKTPSGGSTFAPAPRKQYGMFCSFKSARREESSSPLFGHAHAAAVPPQPIEVCRAKSNDPPAQRRGRRPMS